MKDTEGPDYADRLKAREGAWWKRALDVQAPYRWNLRRQGLGRTLDVGCGIGRNLKTLPPGSVGVDHNVTSVDEARRQGLTAMTGDEFHASDQARPESFDGVLLAHVIEHMDAESGAALLEEYLPFLRSGGKVFFVCPQERGYASDPTHVRFVTGEDLEAMARAAGLVPAGWFSFPFPRFTGRAFLYNEFCLAATKP